LDPIRIRTPSVAHAQRLVAALDGGFAASTDGDGAVHDGNGAMRDSDVALLVDSDTATKLVELFDLLGRWLNDGGLEAVQIGFGERTYTLLAPENGEPANPAGFLFERTIQLQTALDSRLVIEQAKGIIAERESIHPEAAFDRIRREARARRIKLHVLASGIVGTVAQHDGH
jgi:hypothetical protein